MPGHAAILATFALLTRTPACSEVKKRQMGISESQPNQSKTGAPALSIVIPALNEEENVGPLTEEVEKNVRSKGIDAELIIVDDGSTDATLAKLKELAASRDWLVILHRAKPQGQSSAMFVNSCHFSV